ncbi:MAG: P22 coat protein - protein 5 domain protein, partial [Oscillospiraceae bacterium]|nr:P22 coat protein - protein 5 domain protein [Oscillospiraceae bacterium]
TVHINQIGDITIGDYAGTLGDPEELAGTEQTLVIDQAKYFNFMIDDVDNAQTNPKLMGPAMERASYAMNDAVDQYLASLMVAGADTGNVLTADSLTADTAYEYLVDLATALTAANVPMLGRWAVVDPAFLGYLLKDDRFVGNGTEFNQAVLQNGQVGIAAGFTIYISNNGGAHVIAGTNAAGTYAEQLVEMEALRSQTAFADVVRGLHVYGAKVLQPKALAVLSGM